MKGVGAAKRLAAVLIGVALILGACAHHHRGEDGGEDGINAYPTNYKADIVAAMHAYLNDPTAIRDAGIAEPTLRPATITMPSRYIGCVRFNPKKTATVYDGMHEAAAMFLAGRFDQFIEPPKDLCKDVTYVPFPELQNLTR
jgi:hypothetical protein